RRPGSRPSRTAQARTCWTCWRSCRCTGPARARSRSSELMLFTAMRRSGGAHHLSRGYLRPPASIDAVHGDPVERARGCEDVPLQHVARQPWGSAQRVGVDVRGCGPPRTRAGRTRGCKARRRRPARTGARG
ncbi:unnamed protein product, partial [Mycena citricolor]